MKVTSIFVWLIMNLHAACDKQLFYFIFILFKIYFLDKQQLSSFIYYTLSPNFNNTVTAAIGYGCILPK
jgi:hypothetical protein